MTDQSESQAEQLEVQIAQWREFARRRRSVHNADIEELEDHLRAEIDGLTTGGLSADEAFLVAVKRMGSLDAVSHEFAQEHSERLWRQLVLPGTGAGAGTGSDGGTDGGAETELREFKAVLALGLGAALAASGLLAWVDDEAFIRLLPLVILPFLFGYLAWKRNLDRRSVVLSAAAYLVGAAALTLYPFDGDGEGAGADTLDLAALHLPIALWFVVGLAYVGGRWRDHDRRMDFVRFTGEALIYYALIGFGGGVLIALTFGIFDGISVDPDPVITNLVLPGGIAGAVLVAAWLVEARQGVIEAMAPVLTRVFSPCSRCCSWCSWSRCWPPGRGSTSTATSSSSSTCCLLSCSDLVLYSISARDPETPNRTGSTASNWPSS